jgi:hypothetical protein
MHLNPLSSCASDLLVYALVANGRAANREGEV